MAKKIILYKLSRIICISLKLSFFQSFIGEIHYVYGYV